MILISRKMREPGRAVAAALLVGALLAGCGSDEGPAPDRLRVVATTTIWGDVVAAIAGGAVDLEVLLPVGADPHDFTASSRQAAALQEADLVVANGLGLEEGLEDLLTATASGAVPVLEVAAALDPLPLGGDEEALDPHVWLDPLRAAAGARLIAARLGVLDPGRDWSAAAEAYAADAAAAHEQIGEILAGVADRTLVTNHDSLGYFADRYGFRVIGVVVPGGSTLAEPSSADLAALVATMSSAGVTAIFAETTDATTLAEAVVAEVGSDVAVVTLHTGSLGPPGTAAATLLGMLVDNARLIAGALS